MELLPYLYTNPFILSGIEFRSTGDTIKHLEALLDKPEVPEPEKNRIWKLITLMKENTGWCEG